MQDPLGDERSRDIFALFTQSLATSKLSRENATMQNLLKAQLAAREKGDANTQQLLAELLQRLEDSNKQQEELKSKPVTCPVCRHKWKVTPEYLEEGCSCPNCNLKFNWSFEYGRTTEEVTAAQKKIAKAVVQRKKEQARELKADQARRHAEAQKKADAQRDQWRRAEKLKEAELAEQKARAKKVLQEDKEALSEWFQRLRSAIRGDALTVDKVNDFERSAMRDSHASALKKLAVPSGASRASLADHPWVNYNLECEGVTGKAPAKLSNLGCLSYPIWLGVPYYFYSTGASVLAIGAYFVGTTFGWLMFFGAIIQREQKAFANRKKRFIEEATKQLQSVARMGKCAPPQIQSNRSGTKSAVPRKSGSAARKETKDKNVIPQAPTVAPTVKNQLANEKRSAIDELIDDLDPAPIVTTTEYFIRRGQKVVGPYSVAAIKDNLSSGKILDNDEVSAQKEGPWHSIESVSASLFSG